MSRMQMSHPHIMREYARTARESEYPDLWRDFSAAYPLGMYSPSSSAIYNIIDRNKFTATQSTPITWVASRIGQVPSLNGSTYIDTNVTTFDNTSLFVNTSPFSVSMWFRTTSISGTLIAKAGGTQDQRTFQIFYENSVISARLRGINSGGGTLNLNTWYHFVFTYPGTAGNGAIWVDGKIYMASVAQGVASEETSERIIIGARTGGTGFLFTGQLDDIQIRGRALSQSEIEILHEVPFAPWVKRKRIYAVPGSPSSSPAVNYYYRMVS